MAHAESRLAKVCAAAAAVGIFPFGFCVIALLALSPAAVSQTPLPLGFAPETIEYIPPIAKAVLTGNPEEVGKLLSREHIDDRVRAKEGARAGFTPLILAAAVSDPDIALMLIKGGANINILDDFHRSAFWYAALHEDPSLTNILILAPKAGEVVNEPDDDFKRTPLHLAVRSSSRDLVELLIKVGASRSREEKDILGETPIDYCKRRFTGACKALL
jgi:hypothetical protein